MPHRSSFSNIYIYDTPLISTLSFYPHIPKHCYLSIVCHTILLFEHTLEKLRLLRVQAESLLLYTNVLQNTTDQAEIESISNLLL